MIINNDYIFSRFVALIEELQTMHHVRTKTIRVLRNRLPEWLQKFVFSWRNPLYAMLKVKRQCAPKYSMVYEGRGFSSGMHSLDFVHYCLTRDLSFNTADFFPEQDVAYIKEHVDNRIKYALSFPVQPMNPEQKKYFLQSEKFKSHIKKQSGHYVIKYEGEQYCLPENHFSFAILNWHYGLKFLPESVQNYIKGKDFLDIGAYIGDSALLFLKYGPKRIFAYEPVEDTYKKLYETLKLNGLTDIDVICPVKKGIGDKHDFMEITNAGLGSTLLKSRHGAKETQNVEISTIDDECKDKHIGLIKIDIEGFEYFAIKGGLETIKRDKPVLLISAYHTGRDFFEIPPMLKACVPEYKFRLLDIEPFDTAVEKILVAYL